jgi:hypothetical protein
VLGLTPDEQIYCFFVASGFIPDGVQSISAPQINGGATFVVGNVGIYSR